MPGIIPVIFNYSTSDKENYNHTELYSALVGFLF